nr:MAG TPA: hypothetical protein [Caudoviricetes sp.]
MFFVTNGNGTYATTNLLSNAYPIIPMILLRVILLPTD